MLLLAVFVIRLGSHVLAEFIEISGNERATIDDSGSGQIDLIVSFVQRRQTVVIAPSGTEFAEVVDRAILIVIPTVPAWFAIGTRNNPHRRAGIKPLDRIELP